MDFRFETIRRRAAYQLSKVEARAHIVEGLLTALKFVDLVIEIVRSSPDQAASRQALMEAPELALSPEQADSVLKLQLG